MKKSIYGYTGIADGKKVKGIISCYDPFLEIWHSFAACYESFEILKTWKIK